MNKLLRTGIVLVGVSAAMIGLIGCSADKKSDDKNSIKEVDNSRIEEPSELPIATIKVKDFGTINLELYPHKAPNTVKNFIELANSKFYDGLIFHRVIQGFMNQGGCPNGIGTGNPGYSIDGEFSENGYKNNDLKHTAGVISMARSNDPDSAGSQFFIMADDAPHLDGKYAGFGKVTEGLEVVEAINKVETDNSDKPINDIIIEEVRVDTKGVEYSEPIKNK